MRSLSDAEHVAFKADGVVHVLRAFDGSWVDRILPVAERQLSTPSRWANDGNPGTARSRNFTDRNLWKDDPEINAFIHERAGAARGGSPGQRQLALLFRSPTHQGTRNNGTDTVASGRPLLALHGAADLFGVVRTD